MSFLTSIENFFKSLFGSHTGQVIQTVMTDISGLFQKAQPIVAAISAVITAEDMVNPTVVLNKVEGVLATVVTDEQAVQAWITAHIGVSAVTILQDAAQFALSFVSGNVIVKDLEFAVSLAYQVYSKLNPTATGHTVLSIPVSK